MPSPNPRTQFQAGLAHRAQAALVPEGDPTEDRRDALGELAILSGRRWQLLGYMPLPDCFFRLQQQLPNAIEKIDQWIGQHEARRPNATGPMGFF